MRKSGLGKGLGSLIPSPVDPKDGSDLLTQLDVDSVAPNPHQPRHHFDQEGLEALSASIKELGVLQPILVRRLDQGRYELIAGERRLRAAKLAGLETIPGIVREADELASVEQALVENLHRHDLNPLEEAAAYQQLISDFGLTHDLLAQRVGKSRSAISNALRLMHLPAPVQRLVGEGVLSAGHARALLGTEDRAFQQTLARRVVADDLSVRATEEAVKERTGEITTSRSPARERKIPAYEYPPGVLELEEVLSDRFHTRISVDLTPSKGRLVIHFADVPDLERIYSVIMGFEDSEEDEKAG